MMMRGRKRVIVRDEISILELRGAGDLKSGPLRGVNGEPYLTTMDVAF
jgi:hypothetical protein